MPTTQGQVVAALAFALGLAIPFEPAGAQPVIRVEAATRIELTTSRVAGSTRVRAQLVDDQGDPVAGAPIAIRVADAQGQALLEQPRALTGSDGAVEVALPEIDERISVDARFPGDDFRSPVSSVELLDTRLALVELRFTAPAQGVIDLREPTVRVRARARSTAGTAGLRVELTDQAGSPLGAATTDHEGVAEIAIDTSNLGEPGAGKLIGHTHADGTRAAASAELAIVRWLPSQTSLALAQQSRSSVRATGLVRALDRGVPNALVGLFTPRGDHVATLRADANGRYEGTFDPKQLGERNARSLELEARFESDAPWIGSSRSERVRLELAAPSAYDAYWLALTPAVIALISFWLSRRRSALEPARPAKERAEAGVALAQPKPRAVRSHHLACLVLDARTGRAVREATLELLAPNGTSSVVHSDQRGAIRSEELAVGAHQLVFRAPGYRELHVALEAPHRGEWTGAHVRLESLRDVALRAWSPLAQQLAGKPEQANAITLREAILRSATSRGAPASFAHEALQRAERAAYERALPTDDDVQRVEHDASALINSSAAPRE